MLVSAPKMKWNIRPGTCHLYNKSKSDFKATYVNNLLEKNPHGFISATQNILLKKLISSSDYNRQGIPPAKYCKDSYLSWSYHSLVQKEVPYSTTNLCHCVTQCWEQGQENGEAHFLLQLPQLEMPLHLNFSDLNSSRDLDSSTIKRWNPESCARRRGTCVNADSLSCFAPAVHDTDQIFFKL